MDKRIREVAIIGAGISGIVSAKHLTAAGIQVTVFERSNVVGGVWVYDDRQPLEPRYPSISPSIADLVYEEDLKELEVTQTQNRSSRADLEYLLHAPPSPCYAGLKNNVPTPLLAVKGHPWNKGTPDFVSHTVIRDYIEKVAAASVEETEYSFNTRVDKVWKEGQKWQVASTKLEQLSHDQVNKSSTVRDFDAVIVASGHYHSCNVPDTPGLKEWKKAWPTRVSHSKGYRTPDSFKNQNVLLVGASASSCDIAREIAPIAGEVYQVSRGGQFDLPAGFLPETTRRIGEIESFGALDTKRIQAVLGSLTNGALDQVPIPGDITLKDGSILRNIHRVILCTGYHCSYPFLSYLHQDLIPPALATAETLVTDGTQTHNLHKDIFYIPDPTLVFVGVPYYSATFSLFEFQAMAVAAVFAGRAQLPNEELMREEYNLRVQRKGFGRSFHSVRGEEAEYVADLIGWVNRDGAKVGAPEVEGHTAEWLAKKTQFLQMIRERLDKAQNGVRSW